jgi:hypothetical protein
VKFAGYDGSHKMVADDGSVWREATQQELFDPDPELVVWFGKTDTEPATAKEYAHLRLPGNYPFLAGWAALAVVYVKAEL